MSAAPLKLEYELTGAELRAAFDRHFSRVRSRSSSRKLGAAFVLLALFSGWDNFPWWVKGLLFLVALEMLLFDRWLIRWLTRSTATFQVVIETDDRGLRIRDPARKLGSRFWWSRLSAVEQTEYGIELYFDKQKWSELEIPWKAFASDAQRREFLDLINVHLPNASHSLPT